MSSIIKFFLDLSRTFKSFALFYLAKFKKSQKIEKQKELDKIMVARLGGKKMPNWKQFKKLPRTLTKTEKITLELLVAVFLISSGFLFYNGYYKNLITVPKNGGDMSEGLIGSPLYLNPLLAYSDADRDLSRLIFSGLIKYNEKLEPVPDLAEKYEISADQKIYTFYLKKNVKWHDGKDLTAADVIFTIASIQNPDWRSPLYRSFSGVTAEKIDDYTVKFTLAQPYASFINLLAVGLIPQHIWSEISADKASLTVYNQKPIGSGPYKFTRFTKDKNGVVKAYTLEKNQAFYGKTPYINKIFFKFYPDYESAVDGLTNKEIQNLSYLPKEYFKKISARGGKRDLNISNPDLSQYSAIFFNARNNDLLADKKIKEALMLAIDKNKLVEEVLVGQGKVIEGPILPNFLGYDPNIKKYEYNPQKALEILTQNGWTIDGELLKKKGKDLKITLTTVEQDENVKAANLIKDFWASIGVNVELQFFPKEKIENDVIMPRNYQALLYGESVGYDPDLFPFWHSSQRESPGLNLSNYSNRKVDLLLEEARQTNDPKVRSAKYQEFQALLIADLPAIFLYSPTYTYPVNKKNKNITLQRIVLPADRFINIENWYIKTKKQFFK